MFSVYVIQTGKTRGKYLRYRAVDPGDGRKMRIDDYVGKKDDATLFLRFEDAREKALSVRRGLSGTQAFVIEVFGDKLGKSHPVKDKS